MILFIPHSLLKRYSQSLAATPECKMFTNLALPIQSPPAQRPRARRRSSSRRGSRSGSTPPTPAAGTRSSPGRTRSGRKNCARQRGRPETDVGGGGEGRLSVRPTLCTVTQVNKEKRKKERNGTKCMRLLPFTVKSSRCVGIFHPPQVGVDLG